MPKQHGRAGSGSTGGGGGRRGREAQATATTASSLKGPRVPEERGGTVTLWSELCREGSGGCGCKAWR